MATTDSAGRPPIARTTSTQSAKSAKSATSARSSHSESSHQSKSKSSSEQEPKYQQDSPKSSKSSAEKRENGRGEATSVSGSKTISGSTAAQETQVIDMSIFNQILELDDDESRDFSRSMVNDYYSQVDATLINMDKALENKALKELSDLGHFLKGSSAALGLARVQASCERIQHAGNLRDEEKGAELTEPQALALINDMLDNVKKQYPEARKQLDQFFDSSS